MKFAVFEGALDSGQASLTAQDMDAAKTFDGEIKTSGTIRVENKTTGKYTLVGCIYDKEGVMRDYASVSFGYIAKGDEKPVILTMGLEATQEFAGQGITPTIRRNSTRSAKRSSRWSTGSSAPTVSGPQIRTNCWMRRASNSRPSSSQRSTPGISARCSRAERRQRLYAPAPRRKRLHPQDHAGHLPDHRHVQPGIGFLHLCRLPARGQSAFARCSARDDVELLCGQLYGRASGAPENRPGDDGHKHRKQFVGAADPERPGALGHRVRRRRRTLRNVCPRRQQLHGLQRRTGAL